MGGAFHIEQVKSVPGAAAIRNVFTGKTHNNNITEARTREKQPKGKRKIKRTMKQKEKITKGQTRHKTHKET